MNMHADKMELEFLISDKTHLYLYFFSSYFTKK